MTYSYWCLHSESKNPICLGTGLLLLASPKNQGWYLIDAWQRRQVIVWEPNSAPSHLSPGEPLSDTQIIPSITSLKTINQYLAGTQADSPPQDSNGDIIGDSTLVNIWPIREAISGLPTLEWRVRVQKELGVFTSVVRPFVFGYSPLDSTVYILLYRADSGMIIHEIKSS